MADGTALARPARRRLLLDLRPMRVSADFRRLTIGSLLSGLGAQMTTFAVALQVYVLTGSSAAVGGVGLAAGAASVVGGMAGGPIIDAVDRRRLVLTTNSCLAAISALFAAQAFAGPGNIWLLYGLVAVQFLVVSVNGPARKTFAPRLLPRELIPAGAAISMLTMHLSLIAGNSANGIASAVADRSDSSAPSTTLRCAMNRRPSPTARRPIAARPPSGGIGGSRKVAYREAAKLPTSTR